MTGAVLTTGRPRRFPWGSLRPALTAVGTVVGLAVLVAALPWLWDSDPAASVLRTLYPEREADPAALEALRRELDLPSNPAVGAAEWLGGLVRGDLGTSWITRGPVAPDVLGALGMSLTLSVAATLVAAVVAAVLLLPALLAGARGRTGGRRGVPAGAAVLAALPEIVLGSVLVLVVAVGWRALPTSGFAGPQYLVLPALALGVPAGGLLARVLAVSVDTTLDEAWVRSWRSWGSSTTRLVAGVARRAVAVAVPQIALLVVGLLGAAVAVEKLFDVPGIGTTALDAVLAQDLPTVQAAVALLVLLGLGLGGLGVLVHRALLGPALAGRELAAGVEVVAPRRVPRSAVAVAALLVALVVAGLPRDLAGDGGRRLAPPSWSLPFGADANGRDLFARFAHGALLTLGSAVAISAICLVVGLAVGIGARSARAGAADVLNALPPVFVGLLVAAVAGPGLLGASVAVALVGWVPLAVHARTLAAEARASGYVRAAELVGASRRRIARRHVLPAVVGPVLRHALARIPHVALALAALSFLGLGAPPDSPEWGAMLAVSQGYLERAPWTVLAPVVGLLGLAGVLASLRER